MKETLPNRLGAPGSPMDRAQTLIEAQHGPSTGWSRPVHEQCSILARLFAGIDHEPPKFTRERHTRTDAA